MGLPIPFGNPNTYPGHSGVDFPQPDGTPIRASGNGVVGLLSRNDRGGFMTWIDYDGGPGVAYAHQWRHYVPRGMRVTEGTVIGYVGSSGHSTGPHLHIEIADQPGEAAVWRYFDRGRVVGAGSAAGSSAQPFTPQQSQEADMILIRRQANNAAYVVYPAKGIKHIPSENEEKLLRYVIPGDQEQFFGLNEEDLSVVMWALGFPELEGNRDRLPLNGGYYWAPARA